MEKFIIEFGTGVEGIIHGILSAVHKLEREGAQKDEISVYIPPLVNRLMQHTSPTQSLIGFNFSTLAGFDITTGYESGVVVVAWDKGEYYNVKPIRLDVQMTKEVDNGRE